MSDPQQPFSNLMMLLEMSKYPLVRLEQGNVVVTEFAKPANAWPVANLGEIPAEGPPQAVEHTSNEPEPAVTIRLEDPGYTMAVTLPDGTSWRYAT